MEESQKEDGRGRGAEKGGGNNLNRKKGREGGKRRKLLYL